MFICVNYVKYLCIAKRLNPEPGEKMGPVEYSIKDVDKLVKFDGKVKNVDVSRLTAPGENYVSVVYKVDFQVEKNGHYKTISSIAKRLPLSNQKDGFNFCAFAMKNEIKWYSEIVPLLEEFAKENQIKMDIYPEYYGARYSLDSSKQQADNDSVLILGNLIPQGYQNDDRYLGCDLITSQAILKSLAQFHALPIIIKIKKPELFQVLQGYFDETRLGGNRPSDSDEPKGPPGPPPGAKPLSDVFMDAIATIPDLAPYLSKIRPLLDRPSMSPESVNKLTKEPWNTIRHNDFWVNNVMVNHREGKEPLVKIVDYQMLSYGSYANDLVFFLLSSVQNEVTKESMDHLLRVYYDELTSILRKGQVDFKLTYEDYLEEVRIAAQSQVEHALTFATIIFGEKGTGIDVAVEEFNPHVHLEGMLKKMNQYHKDKLVLIASEATKRKWL